MSVNGSFWVTGKPQDILYHLAALQDEYLYVTDYLRALSAKDY
ncbi:MAG: hypothetical protein RBT41_05715 [Clostridia bacterium]|jgi:hypothetical protein|nr:hypothetical protein [Clostridia bacterium]